VQVAFALLLMSAGCHAVLPLSLRGQDAGADAAVADLPVADVEAHDFADISPADAEARDVAAKDDAPALCKEGQACVDSASGKAGKCRDGACCTGCWDAGQKKCLDGDSVAACGMSGVDCKPCSATECHVVSGCKNGTCDTSNAPVKTPCQNGDGACDNNGTCCMGCLDSGGACHALGDATCGTGGNACDDCTTKPADVCEAYFCHPTLAACKLKSLSGPLPGCPGICAKGVCCLQCVDQSGLCAADGTADTTCGTGGVPCDDCTTKPMNSSCKSMMGNDYACTH
jgi:hypothetical protein